jgi:hypothetical protein
MLGQRAAIAGAVAMLAITGGSGAFAANHGSSHVTKPTVHNVVHQRTLLKSTANVTVPSGHHCSHSVASAAAL